MPLANQEFFHCPFRHWTNRTMVLNLLSQTTKADAFESTGYATGHVDVGYLNHIIRSLSRAFSMKNETLQNSMNFEPFSKNGKTFKYQMVSDGIMGTQVNLRLSEHMLSTIKSYSKANGFDSVQEFIKETVREKLFEEKPISKKELALVKKLVQASDRNNLYGSEKELFRKLRRK